VLREHVRADATATLGDLREALLRQRGVQVHEQTVMKALKAAGIRRVRQMLP